MSAAMAAASETSALRTLTMEASLWPERAAAAKLIASGGAVAGTVQHAEVRAPRADGIAVLARHHSRDLVQMRQVVRGPGGQQLRQRDDAEGRMASATIEVGRLQIQPAGRSRRSM